MGIRLITTAQYGCAPPPLCLFCVYSLRRAIEPTPHAGASRPSSSFLSSGLPRHASRATLFLPSPSESEPPSHRNKNQGTGSQEVIYITSSSDSPATAAQRSLVQESDKTADSADVHTAPPFRRSQFGLFVGRAVAPHRRASIHSECWLEMWESTRDSDLHGATAQRRN